MGVLFFVFCFFSSEERENNIRGNMRFIPLSVTYCHTVNGAVCKWPVSPITFFVSVVAKCFFVVIKFILKYLFSLQSIAVYSFAPGDKCAFICVPRELLTPQQHYDWGLRALKTVLKACGSLLQQQRRSHEKDKSKTLWVFFFFLF